MPAEPKAPGRRLSGLLWLAAALACALVFAAWLNPHLAVELATAVRSCF